MTTYYNIYYDIPTSIFVRVGTQSVKKLSEPYATVLSEMTLIEEKVPTSKLHYPLYAYSVTLTDFLKIRKNSYTVGDRGITK